MAEEYLLVGPLGIFISLGVVLGTVIGLIYYRYISLVAALALVSLAVFIPLWYFWTYQNYSIEIILFVAGFMIGYIPSAFTRIVQSTLTEIQKTLHTILQYQYKNKT